MISVFIYLVLEVIFASLVSYKLLTVRRLFRTMPSRTHPIGHDDLPTVSLCIPARNETHVMTECIEHALQSTYPKLEIIVLDDGSRDTTQLLIKSFAHAGVRFLEGSTLPSGWLGKNHALDTLYRQASGSLIVFADVDTRFKPESIERLVEYMRHEDADMVSIMPNRNDVQRISMRLSSLRHFWTIFGHSKDTPATSSSAWMIKRSVLKETFDGFKTLPLAVRPELYMARELAVTSKYRFIVSSAYVGITSEKKLSSQRETAARIYYPTFGLLGSVVRMLALFAVLSPLLFLIAIFVTYVINRQLSELLIALLFCSFFVIIAWTTVYRYYLQNFQSVSNYKVQRLFEIVVFREIYLIALSVIAYKRGAVTWKSRPIKIK